MKSEKEIDKFSVSTHVKTIHGKAYKAHRIKSNDNNPVFLLEPFVNATLFLTRERDEKVFGLINQGELDQVDNIEKLYFMNKLNLVPIERVKSREYQKLSKEGAWNYFEDLEKRNKTERHFALQRKK